MTPSRALLSGLALGLFAATSPAQTTNLSRPPGGYTISSPTPAGSPGATPKPTSSATPAPPPPAAGSYSTTVCDPDSVRIGANGNEVVVGCRDLVTKVDRVYLTGPKPRVAEATVAAIVTSYIQGLHLARAIKALAGKAVPESATQVWRDHLKIGGKPLPGSIYYELLTIDLQNDK